MSGFTFQRFHPDHYDVVRFKSDGATSDGHEPTAYFRNPGFTESENDDTLHQDSVHLD